MERRSSMAPPPDSRQLPARHPQPTAPTHPAASPTNARYRLQRYTDAAASPSRGNAAGRSAGSPEGNLQRCIPSHRPDTRPTRPDLQRHTIWRGELPRTRPRQNTTCPHRAAHRTGDIRRATGLPTPARAAAADDAGRTVSESGLGPATMLPHHRTEWSCSTYGHPAEMLRPHLLDGRVAGSPAALNLCRSRLYSWRRCNRSFVHALLKARSSPIRDS